MENYVLAVKREKQEKGKSEERVEKGFLDRVQLLQENERKGWEGNKGLLVCLYRNVKGPGQARIAEVYVWYEVRKIVLDWIIGLVPIEEENFKEKACITV